MTTTTTPKRKCFVKMMTSKTLSRYLAEAKRVNYSVIKDNDAGTFEVLENHPNAEWVGEWVFKGIQKDRSIWIVLFNTAFWEEPTI